MTISFTHHDRLLLMKRFRAAAKRELPKEIVTLLHITEVYGEQRME